MKKMKSYVIILTLFCFALNANASRGDLVNYELLKTYSHKEVVEFFQGNLPSSIGQEGDLMYNIATLFFENLVSQRSIDVYKVIYETIDFNDEETIASGVVLIPRHESWQCKKPFSLYAHGTIFDREAVISRPENFKGEFMLSMMMAASNTICAAPDYYGLGDGPGFHHHNTAKTNGSSSIDILRAGRNLCDLLGVDYNNNLINMGYSEGGAASMAVAKIIKEQNLQNEFDLRFLGCGSGAYDMSDIAYDFIIYDDYYGASAYVMYLLATCQDIYGELLDEGEDFGRYLKSPYKEYFEQNILTQNGNIGWLVQPWTSMFHEDVIEEWRTNPNNSFRNCLAEGNTYDWNNPNLTFLYYCNTDEEVPHEGSLKTIEVQRSYIPWWRFWDRYKIIGLDLALGEGFGDSHPSCALPSILAQVLLMQGKGGLTCEYTGGKNIQNLQEVNNGISYTSNEIDFSSVATESRLTQIEGLNLLNSKKVAIKEGVAQLEDNGIYIFKTQNERGEEQIFWNVKMPINFVNTDDYDPILTNPMNQSTVLDLSLLPEKVNQINIYTLEGELVTKMSAEKFDAQVVIERKPDMVEGDYVVEVVTSKNKYPLKLSVQDGILEADQLFGVSPNPSRGLVEIRLKNTDEPFLLEVFNSIGQLVKTYQSKSSSLQTVDLSELSKDLYTLKVTQGKNTHIEKLIIQ